MDGGQIGQSKEILLKINENQRKTTENNENHISVQESEWLFVCIHKKYLQTKY